MSPHGQSALVLIVFVDAFKACYDCTLCCAVHCMVLTFCYLGDILSSDGDWSWCASED